MFPRFSKWLDAGWPIPNNESMDSVKEKLCLKGDPQRCEAYTPYTLRTKAAPMTSITAIFEENWNYDHYDILWYTMIHHDLLWYTLDMLWLQIWIMRHSSAFEGKQGLRRGLVQGTQVWSTQSDSCQRPRIEIHSMPQNARLTSMRVECKWLQMIANV